MKKTVLALLAAGMLGACATQPAQPAKRAGVNPALNCGVLPVTEYLWGEGYRKMLDTPVQPEWAYPAYVGLSTGGWALATLFVPAVDILVAPLRIGEPCT
jgi:hypothetical protein